VAAPPPRAEILARALAYPFGVPAGSYVLDRGRAEPLDASDLDAPGRVALLAIGANASPEALVRKLGERAGQARIPAVAARLHDFEVVYSAHVSPYGSIAAALQHSPGAIASVHVVHLEPWQFELVHRTEHNYVMAQLEQIRLEPEAGTPLDSVRAYLTRHGCLWLDDGHVGLAAIPVAGRRWPALDEPAILARVRDALEPGADLDDFICEAVLDPSIGDERTARLRATARPLAWSHWRALET
jgi:hypothetical protein